MGINSIELAGPLKVLPPADFCCAYGSFLLSNNTDKNSMVDYIIGVADPEKWHAENFERNRNHYSRWMVALGPKMITSVADRVGAGVHFNPFVEWKDKIIKYGVVRMHDLAQDILTWDQFYLSGRLQKPVCVLIDNWDIRKVNLVNLKAAMCAALLLLPPTFTEEDLYVKICGLSYMGDLRMLFAEDKDKVKKIVQGSFKTFQAIYKPLLKEFADEGLLEFGYCPHSAFQQDCGFSATTSLFGSLPSTVHSTMFWGKHKRVTTGELPSAILVNSREQASSRVRRALRRAVMVSSARQAVSGLLTTGGVNAARYLMRKMSKAWKSRTI
ncbi:phosphatidate cytidylyltransferase, mitochondrial isoform X2 [Phalaenopsis equestris]|uniref:phosphatidate cytidylyltransferase, mitochondrial isoform X2 n=1 Tax=Phalaenopsis equestris TaxID=78828 RepID=UPI0009E288D0|nr:phosphatidate cytidylyltransferase, mitochondrial isoform X2 [Phalaenopsis equestris]